MSTEPKTIVVEISGPQASGKTTLAEFFALELYGILKVRGCKPGLMRYQLHEILRTTGSVVEIHEKEYDDRDRELASLRQERDRLRQDVERLKAEVARQSDKARGFDK